MYADMPRVETFAEPGLLGMMTDLPDPMLNRENVLPEPAAFSVDHRRASLP
jgi:hypothetical protein